MSDALELEIKKYTQQLAADPKSRAFVPLSEAYRKLGRYDESITVAREGVTHHPHYVSGKMALARALFENGDVKEAQELLESIAHLSPDNLLANRLLATIYVQQGEGAKAVPFLKQILSLDPSDARARTQLEEVEKKKEPAPAKPPETSVPQSPRTATLAELYRSQGHLEQALEIYQELLTLDPQNLVYLEETEKLKQDLQGKKQRAGGEPSKETIHMLEELRARIQERRKVL